MPTTLTQSRIPPYFERVIYYLLAPELFARVVLELGLGMYFFRLTQQKQLVFYLLILIDFGIHLTRLSSIKLNRSTNTIAALLFIVMLIHGFAVGFYWSNSTQKIITDSIPVLVLAINTLLFSDEKSHIGFDRDRVFLIVRIYAALMVTCGIIATGIGRPSVVNLGGAAGTPLCITILIVGTTFRRNVKASDLALLAYAILPVVPNFNRTTLVVVVIEFVVFVVPKLLRSGRTLYVGVVALLLAAVATPMVLPPESALMRRLNALVTSDRSPSEGGSLGEREAEREAVNERLHVLRPEGELFGLGAGGTYTVVFTGGVVPQNYSHAHYGFVLFRLRYGDIGYIYLALFGLLMVINAIANFRQRTFQGNIIAFLGIFGCVFMLTYMFFNQLIAGLQFARPPAGEMVAQRRPRRPLSQERPATVAVPGKPRADAPQPGRDVPEIS